MEPLDPDDSRPPYQQVADSLRTSILNRRYAPGEKLPSGNDMARHYGVARMTVQQALRILRDEDLIVSRQGSGVFVRSRTVRPVGLRPHVEQAFASGRVTMDFAGLSGETLHGVLQEPLDLVRAGQHRPQLIRVRVLLPDPARPWTLPCRIEDLGDDPEFRARAEKIMQRHVGPLVDSITELAELGLVPEASIAVRLHHAAPLFKLYIVNGTEAFFGFYPVEKHTVTIAGDKHAVYDLMGKDTTLFHHATDGDAESIGAQYVAQAQTWFDSMWNTIAVDHAG
jgi:DNA-binding transcriptional regulator YhcF (GntR family)